MIRNIHFLTNPDADPEPNPETQATQEALLTEAHERGEHLNHPPKLECPLCRLV